MRVAWNHVMVLVVVSAFAACAGPVSPSGSMAQPQLAGAMTTAVGSGQMAVSADAGPKTRRVTMMDACDGPSFNLIIGPGTCSRPHGVGFQEFIDQLTAQQTVGSWHNAPAQTDAKLGDTLVAVNNGGEAHTFTLVGDYGGGIVPLLNALSGTPNEVPECAAETTFVPPGGSNAESLNKTGELKFQCCIHPWMRTTVRVK